MRKSGEFVSFQSNRLQSVYKSEVAPVLHRRWSGALHVSQCVANNLIQIFMSEHQAEVVEWTHQTFTPLIQQTNTQQNKLCLSQKSGSKFHVLNNS